MSAHNRPPENPDSLDQAIDALLSTPTCDGPTELLMDATRQSVEERRRELTSASGRRPQYPRTVRYLGFGALATAAMLLIGIILSGIGGGTAAALDKAMERVRAAESVRFRVLDRVKPTSPDAESDVPDWLRETITYAHSRPANDVMISGRKFRIDDVLGPGSIWIIDWERKEALISDPVHRAFQKMDMHRIAVSPLDIESMNVCDELLALRKQKARFDGADVVDGQQADKYVVNNGKAFHTQGNWAIWIGHATGLPVKVTVDYDLRGVVVSRVYDHFDWNPNLASELFSLNAPEGFREQSILRPLVVTPRIDATPANSAMSNE